MSEQQNEATSAVFNDLAERAANHVKQYQNAITLMQDMQEWGMDPKGYYFTFEPAYDGLAKRTILVGTLNNYMDHGSKGEVPTLFVGLSSTLSSYEGKTPAGCEFTIAERWTSPSAPMSERIQTAYDETGNVGTGKGNPTWASSAQSAGTPVVSFAEKFMYDHPGFQRAVKDAARKAIDKIATNAPRQ